MLYSPLVANTSMFHTLLGTMCLALLGMRIGMLYLLHCVSHNDSRDRSFDLRSTPAEEWIAKLAIENPLPFVDVGLKY